MIVKQLSSRLKLVNRVSNASSLTSLYKSIEVSNLFLKAVSEYGIINVALDEETGIKNPVLLDCDAFCSVVDSLPPEGNLTFTEDTNRLKWKCSDSIKGHLNHVQTKEKVPTITHENYPWEPPDSLGKALKLAATACKSAAISLGLYGVSIEPVDGHLELASSNATSLARAVVEKGNYPGGQITLRPPVPDIISLLLGCSKKSYLDVDKDGFYVLGDFVNAHLPLGSTLEHNLRDLSQPFIGVKESFKVDRSAVQSFLSRSKNLTEKKSNFRVSLEIKQGKLILTHAGIASSSEQWFMAAGLPADIEYKSVSVDASELDEPLSDVDNLVTDYLTQQKLVLRGSSPDFMYIIGGGD